jgi:hypothetical protein
MNQAAAMARLSFCRGLVYWGALPPSPVHSLLGREEVRPAPAATVACVELQAVLRGSAAQLALAAGGAWA